jgi:hypothetical protein
MVDKSGKESCNFRIAELLFQAHVIGFPIRLPIVRQTMCVWRFLCRRFSVYFFLLFLNISSYLLYVRLRSLAFGCVRVGFFLFSPKPCPLCRPILSFGLSAVPTDDFSTGEQQSVRLRSDAFDCVRVYFKRD